MANQMNVQFIRLRAVINIQQHKNLQLTSEVESGFRYVPMYVISLISQMIFEL